MCILPRCVDHHTCRCSPQARPSTSFVDNIIDLPWRNFLGPEFGIKLQREVPLLLEIPEFPYNTVYRICGINFYAKTSSIGLRPVVSIQYRLAGADPGSCVRGDLPSSPSLLSLRSRVPLNQLEGLGERCKTRPKTNLVHYKAVTVSKPLVAIILSILKCTFYSRTIKIYH